MKKDNFFENWYKKKLEEGNETPPDDIWKNISKELDIYSVWNNISTELDHKETKKRRRVALAYIFSITCLFFVGAWIFFMSESSLVNSDLATNKNIKTPINTNLTSDLNGVIEKNVTEKLIRKDDKTIDLNASVSMTVSIINDAVSLRKMQAPSTSSISGMTMSATNMKVQIVSMTVPVTNMTVPITGAALPIMEVNENASNNSGYSTDTRLTDEYYTLNEGKTERDYILPINLVEKHLFTDTNLLVLRQPPFDTLAILSGSNEESKVGRFYAGVVFSVQNPWLMNRYTYNSMLESSINEVVPGVGICYGVSSAYSFTHGWNVNCDLFIQSRYGQAYNSYNNGTYEKEKINLDYKQINLYGIKRKDRQLKNKNLIFSNGPLLGLNVKYLYYASKTINGLKNDATKQYTKYDLGVLIGYEYSLSLKRDWLFSTSINGDFGLNNIYSGKGLEAKAFNKTNNASLRWACSIRYLIN